MGLKDNEDIKKITIEELRLRPKQWTGSPDIKGMFITKFNVVGWIIVALLFLLPGDFEDIPFNKPVLFGIFLLAAAVGALYTLYLCKTMTYYVTDIGPAVKKGNSVYLIPWESITAANYKIYIGLGGIISKCRCYRFARKYSPTGKRDLYRYKARFWCIKGHEELEAILNKNMGITDRNDLHTSIF